MSRRKKHCSFVQQSRGRRSREGFKLRQRVERDKHIYGGRFTSYWIIEDDEPVVGSFDFIFPGLNKYDIWRACIGTARNAFLGEINMRAISQVWDMLSPEERAFERKMKFIPARRDSLGKVLSYTLEPREDIRYAQFDELTMYEYRQRLMREMIASDPPEIYESFDLDFSFRYGVGLYIVVDADRISYPLIDQTINRFLELGQKSWRGDKPVSRDRLPFEMPA